VLVLIFILHFLKFCRDSPTYPVGLMYFIFRTFVQFKEDRKSWSYNIDMYIHIESLHLWENNFKMNDE